MENVLDKVIEVVSRDSHSGQSLLLFALMATLNVEKGGHMYMLSKLKEFSEENRPLAYGLMELMAQGKVGDEAWQRAYSKVESTIRG